MAPGLRILVIVLALLGAGCTTPAAKPLDATPLEPATDTPAPSPTNTESESPETSPPSEPPSSEPEPSQPEPENETQPSQSSSRPFEPEGATQPCNSLEFRSPLTAATAGLATGWPLLALDVVMLADPTFVEAHPDDWTALLQALIDDASKHFEAQFSLRLRAILIDRLPTGTLDPSRSDMRDVARGFMQTNHPEVSFDYTALILGADYDGTVAGQVECVGGAFTPDTAYLSTEYREERTPSVITPDISSFADTPLKVFMHESAHLLGAHHHYTNCGEAFIGYSTDDALAACGVMINDIGLASLRFSPTNRLVVRSFVEEHRLGEPVEAA